MIQSDEVTSLTHVANMGSNANPAASLNLFNPADSPLKSVTNTNANLLIDNVTDISSSFSKLNNENIAQMINQAQLLDFGHEQVAKAVASSVASSNTTTTTNTKATTAVLSTQPKLTNQNLFKHNNSHAKFNNRHNYNNNFSTSLNMPFNSSNSQNHTQNFNKNKNFHFKNANRFPNSNNMMNRNGGGNYIAPLMTAVPQPPHYMPFGFGQPPSYFLGGNSGPRHHHRQHANSHYNQQSPSMRTPPPYFYNTNAFNNSKYTYQNYRSYLQAKKAEVIKQKKKN